MLYVIKRRVVTITFYRLDCENRRIDFMKYFTIISIQLKILYILNCYTFFWSPKSIISIIPAIFKVNSLYVKNVIIIGLVDAII